MPRKYQRKAPDRTMVTEEQLETAKLLISKGASKRKAASQVGITESTLRKRLKIGKVATSLGRFSTTFNAEQEKDIYKYIKGCDDFKNNLTMQNIQKFLYEYAEINKITHRFNTTTKVAGREFVYRFLKRFPGLKLQKPDETTTAIEFNLILQEADPALVPSGGGEGSLETKPAKNICEDAKSSFKIKEEVNPEEILQQEQIKQEIKEEPLENSLPNSPESVGETPKDPLQIENSEIVPKVEELKEEPKESEIVEESKPNESASSGNWQEREQELLKKIEDLEKVKTERTEDGLKLELKVREEEIDLLKARVKNLETELQAALSKPGAKNQDMIEKIKQQHEELLSKARGMIFDKTKMVKNQELQIEALTTQVQSLKDINLITKDLLEIRNSEVKAMEDRFQAMESRFKAEKERYDLVLKRAQTSNNINDDLRKEYETQLAIFKELREKYELRVQALVAENNRLKESLQGGTSG